IPYYNEDTLEFKKSLASQTVPHIVIRRDRKKDKILWTKAVNDFYKECFTWNIKDNDVICVMNNDIEFGKDLFEVGGMARCKGIVVPKTCLTTVNWQDKKIF